MTPPSPPASDLRLRLDSAAREVDAAAPTEGPAVSVDGGAEAEQPVRVHLEDAPNPSEPIPCAAMGWFWMMSSSADSVALPPSPSGPPPKHVDGLVDLDTAARVDL